MPAFLATSCLQGRPLQSACEELLELGPDGLQLTGGHAPTANFRTWIKNVKIAHRTHHGYTPDAYARRVWTDDGRQAEFWDSVHPPAGDVVGERLAATALEVMYPGCQLGTGREVEQAMQDELPLAIDVSHIFIQLTQGTMSVKTWTRIQDYEHIAEIHVSANDGRKDCHRPIATDTFGLEWARARERAGSVVVLESYLHRHSSDERRRQLDLPDPDIAKYLAATIAVEESDDDDDYAAFEWLCEGFDAAYAIGEIFDANAIIVKDWGRNHEAIPLFAAYCKEGAHQNMPVGEAYAPYAVFRVDQSRKEPSIEVIGRQLRPWLDGVAPSW